MQRFLALALFFVLFAGLPTAAQAGPPCICWDLDIGEHASIPTAGSDEATALSPRAAANAALKILARDDLPALVHMETLRRATLHVHDDTAVAEYLLSRVLADAGYLVACYNQMGRARDLDGYPWLKRAIDTAKDPSSYHFAAALVTVLGSNAHHDRYETHLAGAMAGVRHDVMLAKNLKTLQKRAPAILEYFAKKR
jgi:hypothetical protein